MNDIEQFLDLAYGAAVQPDLWPAALERFADLLGAESAALVWQDQADRKGSGIAARLDPKVLDLYFGQFAKRHPSQRWMDDPLARVRHFVPRIVADDEVLAKPALMRTSFYNDFLRPFDIHSILRLGLAAEGTNVALMMVSRPRRRQPFGPEEHRLAAALQPHLLRAFALKQRLEAAHGIHRGLDHVFEHSPHGLFILGSDGRILRMNAAGAAFLAGGRGLAVSEGRLTASRREQARAFQALLAGAGADAACGRGSTMALYGHPGDRPLSATVTPLPAWSSLLGRHQPGMLVTIADPADRPAVPADRLRALYGLTPTEVRIALALAGGLAPAAVAHRLGLSSNTVRNHLARVFDKTGTRRQAELVRLLIE